MLLASLVRFAERKRLGVDTAFEHRPVDFVVQIGADGRFLGLISRQEAKGTKLVGTVMQIPRLPKRTVGVSAGILVDNVKYVLGVGDSTKDRPERVAQCADAFRRRVEELAKVTGADPGIAAALAFLGDRSAREKAARTRSAWTGSEIAALQLRDDHEPVHQRPAVRSAIARMGTGRAAERRCLVSGRHGAIARLHPPVKRVPGGQSSGTSLVSFNGPAFTSHGLSQGDNAPITEEVAVGYTSALNYMLEGTQTRQYRSGIRLGGSAVLLVWTDTENPFAELLIDALDPPFLPKESRAGQKKRRSAVATSAIDASGQAFAEAPWKRITLPAVGEETIALFGVVLSGNAARAVVRQAFSTTIAATKRHVGRWFRALALRRSGAAESPTIPMILKALEPAGNADLPPNLSSRLTVAAVLGHPLPAELLRHALLRFRQNDRFLTFSRAAVIKACLVNLSRLKETDVSLNEEITDQAYLLGRLFAVLERAQENALPGLNATIRDRYFTAASTSPGIVFPRLLRLAQHHVSKANAENRGFGIERKVQSIISALPAKRFPALLSLADQGMFAVGYYHQREALFAKKDAAKETV